MSSINDPYTPARPTRQPWHCPPWCTVPAWRHQAGGPGWLHSTTVWTDAHAGTAEAQLYERISPGTSEPIDTGVWLDIQQDGNLTVDQAFDLIRGISRATALLDPAILHQTPHGTWCTADHSRSGQDGIRHSRIVHLAEHEDEGFVGVEHRVEAIRWEFDDGTIEPTVTVNVPESNLRPDEVRKLAARLLKAAELAETPAH